MSRFFGLSTSTIKSVASTQHQLADYYLGRLQSLECGRHLMMIWPDGPLGLTDWDFARTLGADVYNAVSNIDDCAYDMREALDELETRRLPN
jgi:hypothetical protein